MSEPWNYEEFRLNMRSRRIKVEMYNRRFGDDRPAVRADDDLALQAIIRATPVVLEWDTLGEGYIVYPIERAPRED